VTYTQLHSLARENLAIARGLAEAIAEMPEAPDLDGVRDVARTIMQRVETAEMLLDREIVE
jgi:hypothetical protein